MAIGTLDSAGADCVERHEEAHVDALPPPAPETRVGFRPHPGWAIGAWVVAATVALGLAWVGVVLARHYDEPVYRIDGFQVAVSTIAGVVVVIGAFLLVRNRRHDVAVLGTAAAVLVFVGALAILSIGILFLLLAVWPILAMARRLSRDSAGSKAAIAAGPLIGLGLAALLFTMPRAVVRCTVDGVSVSSGWRDQGSSSGGGHVTADGDARGAIRFGNRSFVYQCRNGELVEFHQE